MMMVKVTNNIKILFMPIGVSLSRMPKAERHLRTREAKTTVVRAVNQWLYSR